MTQFNPRSPETESGLGLIKEAAGKLRATVIHPLHLHPPADEAHYSKPGNRRRLDFPPPFHSSAYTTFPIVVPVPPTTKTMDTVGHTDTTHTHTKQNNNVFVSSYAVNTE